MLHLLMITPEVDLNQDARGFIHQWVESLSKRVGKLDVITMKKGEIKLPDNVSVHTFFNSKNKIIAVIKFYLILGKLLKNNKIDLVFVHMIPMFAIMAAPLCWIRRQPLILWYTHGQTSLTLKLSSFCVNKIVTAGFKSFGNFKINNSKLLVTGHGIDTDFFYPNHLGLESERDVKLVSIGRLSPSKDYKTIIKALPEVIRKTQKTISYTIIGQPFPNTPEDNLYFDELKKMVKNLALEKIVIFAGVVPFKEIVPYYHNCHIFINPSLTGSLDKTGLEAMACAKPVLSCNSCYLSLFGNYREDLFFKSENSDDAARKLIELIKKPDNYLRLMGLNLRAGIIEKHNLNKLMDKLVKIFNDEIRY